MFRKKSIALRIALGYLAVVLLTALLIGASFWLMLSGHLEQAARENLQRDARNLSEIYSDQPETGFGQPGMMMRRFMNYQVLGRAIQGEYILVNGRGVVLDSSINEAGRGDMLDPMLVEKLAAADIYEGRVALGEQQYVAAARYTKGVNGYGGAVVLLTRVEGLNEIKKELLYIFIVSLGVASLVALLLTALLARRISRPLELLKEKAHRVAERNFGWRVQVDAGDEIGELGQAINVMDEKLADYDRVQKQFFQNASHELKSPLMSIQGYAEGVRDGVFTGQEANQALEIILRETGRLKNLVEELVFLGKLESVFGGYNFTEIELLEVLEQAVESQRVVALEKEINIKITSCPDVYLWADGEKIVRLFVNLISNALRHADTQVELSAEIIANSRVRIAVRDDGPGFTAEDLQNIWNRFYKGPRGGSGLGLPIAKAIVEEHVGTIKASNLPEGGAQIVILLPLKGNSAQLNPC